MGIYPGKCGKIASVSRKIVKDWGAVSARHTKGIRPPPPRWAGAGGAVPGRRLRRVGSRRSPSGSVPGRRVPRERLPAVCLGGRFRRIGSPGSAPCGVLFGVGSRRVSGRAVCPGGRKKSRAFFFFPATPTRMYKEAAGSFSEKKPLTFPAKRAMDVSAGQETAQKRQPGTRVGREKPPPEERSPP